MLSPLLQDSWRQPEPEGGEVAEDATANITVG
jgi:hypothetical protein